jgi:hypothetical protein
MSTMEIALRDLMRVDGKIARQQMKADDGLRGSVEPTTGWRHVARPRANAKPWEREGIARATYFRRKAELR